MLINLENVFNGSADRIDACFDFDFSSIEMNGVHPFKTPVYLRGVIENKTGIVYIRAEASFTYHGVCSRCACDFQREMKVPVDHILVSELNDEDNDEFILVENMLLNIEDLVREDVLLSLPYNVLCREECKGMCSRCGKNLNEGDCDCEKEIDPRLEVLKQFFTD